MKVTVKDYLNVRVGKPSVNAPTFQYLAPGSEIEIDDQLYKGDLYEGVDTWVKDHGENYYWSGGLHDLSRISANKLLIEAGHSQFDWYHHEFGILDAWNEFGVQGEGVKVAVLDSGLKKDHIYFKDSNISGINYFDKTNPDFSDKFGHGTSVSSVLIANGDELIGVAPKCNLFAAKVFEYTKASPAQIQETISKLPDDIEIIVIAHSFLKQDIPNDFDAVFKNSNKIFVCTPGNDENHDLPVINRYPASLGFKNVLSVAACRTDRNIYPLSTKSDFISLTAPGGDLKVISTSSNKPTKSSGTSFSAPFVAGTLALMRSLAIKKRKACSTLKLVEILIQSCKPTNENPLLYGHGFVDPLNALRKINNL